MFSKSQLQRLTTYILPCEVLAILSTLSLKLSLCLVVLKCQCRKYSLGRRTRTKSERTILLERLKACTKLKTFYVKKTKTKTLYIMRVFLEYAVYIPLVVFSNSFRSTKKF